MQGAEEKREEVLRVGNISLDEMQVRKGANLMIKILSIVLIPMVILIIFAALSLEAVGNDTAEKLVEQELRSTEYAMELCMNNLSTDGYRYENGNLYKGQINLSQDQYFLKNFKDNTGVDIAFFWGNELIVTGIEGATVKVDEAIMSAVLSGQDYFDAKLRIGKMDYYAYLAPVYADGSATPEGALMTAIPIAETEAIYEGVIFSNVRFMFILLAVFCAITILVVLLITRALMTVVGNLNSVAEGNLQMTVSEKILKRSDEVGKIARSVYSVVEGFAKMVVDIQNSMRNMNEFTGRFKENFDTIGQSMSSINIAVTDIAEGATQQAADTQRVSESMEDMNEALNKTADSVNALSNSAATMKEENDTVNNTLKDLFDISVRTKASVDEVQRQTNLTNESVQAIQAATDIIAGIANQTNLLSLNASIEAARAGEMGRGFAVVAEEIRGLADQSRESADQIRGVVETLMQNSNHSVEVMDGVVGEIHQQNEKLEVTRDAFAHLNDEIMSVVGAINTISAELERIEAYKDEVTQRIEGLSEISQNNAASTEETAATMEQLGQIVDDCQRATGELVTIANELTQGAKKFKLY